MPFLCSSFRYAFFLRNNVLKLTLLIKHVDCICILISFWSLFYLALVQLNSDPLLVVLDVCPTPTISCSCCTDCIFSQDFFNISVSKYQRVKRTHFREKNSYFSIAAKSLCVCFCALKRWHRILNHTKRDRLQQIYGIEKKVQLGECNMILETLGNEKSVFERNKSICVQSIAQKRTSTKAGFRLKVVQGHIWAVQSWSQCVVMTLRAAPCFMHAADIIFPPDQNQKYYTPSKRLGSYRHIRACVMFEICTHCLFSFGHYILHNALH